MQTLKSKSWKANQGIGADSDQPFKKHIILKKKNRQCLILLPDNPIYYLSVILVPCRSLATHLLHLDDI